jgi:predicted O-methyltransferase YrrM
MDGYEFTNSWFTENAKAVWDQLLPQVRPRTLLEIGSFEGASACYLIEHLGNQYDIELHCIDTWGGGLEHQPGGQAVVNMHAVEERFKRNTQIAICEARNKVELFVHKGLSDDCLAGLIQEGKKGYFEFIYIDGSHQAPDVLCDAVLGFKLLRVGGLMAFDDYLWSEDLAHGKDPIRCPKPAIDAFVNLNIRKLAILTAPLYQLYLQKTSD